MRRAAGGGERQLEGEAATFFGAVAGGKRGGDFLWEAREAAAGGKTESGATLSLDWLPPSSPPPNHLPSSGYLKPSKLPPQCIKRAPMYYLDDASDISPEIPALSPLFRTSPERVAACFAEVLQSPYYCPPSSIAYGLQLSLHRPSRQQSHPETANRFFPDASPWFALTRSDHVDSCAGHRRRRRGLLDDTGLPPLLLSPSRRRWWKKGALGLPIDDRCQLGLAHEDDAYNPSIQRSSLSLLPFPSLSRLQESYLKDWHCSFSLGGGATAQNRSELLCASPTLMSEPKPCRGAHGLGLLLSLPVSGSASTSHGIAPMAVLSWCTGHCAPVLCIGTRVLVSFLSDAPSGHGIAPMVFLAGLLAQGLGALVLARGGARPHHAPCCYSHGLHATHVVEPMRACSIAMPGCFLGAVKARPWWLISLETPTPP
ncbi:hypothetical protein CK203_102734 [Vitis vinifera]|uniref:Uncharacterized protein n=1 Tax=Vitis vinifera TaxID=29760 RepID=A0A438C6A0_VITVI|nr:hypothetical protein CK203_102734 [Vitis vinifera]